MRSGPTLIHEHIFVRNPELEVEPADPEWAPRGRSRPPSRASRAARARGADGRRPDGARAGPRRAPRCRGRRPRADQHRCRHRLVHAECPADLLRGSTGPGRRSTGPSRWSSCSCETSVTASRDAVRAGMLKVMTDATGSRLTWRASWPPPPSPIGRPAFRSPRTRIPRRATGWRSRRSSDARRAARARRHRSLGRQRGPRLSARAHGQRIDDRARSLRHGARASR